MELPLEFRLVAAEGFKLKFGDKFRVRLRKRTGFGPSRQGGKGVRLQQCESLTRWRAAGVMSRFVATAAAFCLAILQGRGKGGSGCEIALDPTMRKVGSRDIAARSM